MKKAQPLDIMRAREFAISVSLQALQRILVKRFGKAPGQCKADGTVVTAADKTAEDFLLKKISTTYPRHQVLGEETGFKEGEDHYCWIIDPLSGSHNYANGVPVFGIQVALWDVRRPFPLLSVLQLYKEGQATTYWALGGSSGGAFQREEKDSRVSMTTFRRFNIQTMRTDFRQNVFVVPEGAFSLDGQPLPTHPTPSLVEGYIGLAERRYSAILYRGVDLADFAAGATFIAQAGGTVMISPLDHIRWQNTPQGFLRRVMEKDPPALKKEFAIVATNNADVFPLLQALEITAPKASSPLL